MTTLPPSKNRVLVTGGGGFLGSAVVKRLLASGHEPVSFSRSRHRVLDGLNVPQISGDISDPEAVSHAIQGCGAVIHTAALAGVWGPFEAFDRVNRKGAQNVVDACLKHGAKALVHTSSPSVVFDGNHMEGVNESVPYPDHYSAFYPQTKAMAEKCVLSAVKEGLPALVLRPHLIWGPGDPHLAPRILARAARLRRVGDGANKVDTIYIDNAAHAHVLALENLLADPGLSGRIYFISQDEPVRLWEMIDHILAAGKKPPVKKSISPKAAFLIGSVLEGLYKLMGIRAEPPMTRFVAEELATSHWFDITAAKKDLGYEPLVSTREGLKRLAASLESVRPDRV